MDAFPAGRVEGEGELENLAILIDQPTIGIAFLVTGLRKQLLGLFRIVLILGHVGVFINAGGEVGVELQVLVVEKLLDELVAIVEMGEGLADANVVEGPLTHVESQAADALNVFVEDLPLEANAPLDLIVVEFVDPPAGAAHHVDIQLALLELLEPEALVHDDGPFDLVEIVEAGVLRKVGSPPVVAAGDDDATAVVHIVQQQFIGPRAHDHVELELFEVFAAVQAADDMGRHDLHGDCEVEEVAPVFFRRRHME